MEPDFSAELGYLPSLTLIAIGPMHKPKAIWLKGSWPIDRSVSQHLWSEQGLPNNYKNLLEELSHGPAMQLAFGGFSSSSKAASFGRAPSMYASSPPATSLCAHLLLLFHLALPLYWLQAHSLVDLLPSPNPLTGWEMRKVVAIGDNENV